eukprot:m.60198 g.60198  ORF g.60198 m.60198 type:complete len:298 (+) comp11303_c0_seq1:255-1148(+)
MICTECNSPLTSNSNFCSVCGARVGDAAKGGLQPSAPPPPDDDNADAGPSRAHGRSGGITRALEHAECAICFEPLYTADSAYLADSRGRVCRHFYHHICIQAMPQTNCPMCRSSFERIEKLPKLEENALAWFKAVDLDGNGGLSRQELMDALKTQLPVDWRKLEREMIPSHWDQFDPNGDGSISYDELTRPDGVLAWVKRRFPQGKMAEAPPVTEKLQWFEFWDEDDSGELDQDEVVRALAKTFHYALEPAKVRGLQEMLSSLWVLFDTDGGGGIDKEEFCKADGLGDTIIASTQMM